VDKSERRLRHYTLAFYRSRQSYGAGNPIIINGKSGFASEIGKTSRARFSRQLAGEKTPLTSTDAYLESWGIIGILRREEAARFMSLRAGRERGAGKVKDA